MVFVIGQAKTSDPHEEWRMQFFEVTVDSLADRLDVSFYRVRQEVRTKLGRRRGPPLAELCTRIGTKTPARDAYSQSGVPCIKLRNVTGHFIDLTDCDYIPARLKSKYVTAKKHDLIITATGEGTAGRVDMFLDDSVPCVVTGENILLRPNPGRMNPFYLLAALRADLIALQLRHFVRGATGQTHLYWHDIREIEIPEAQENVQKGCQRIFLEAEEIRKRSEQLLAAFKRQAEDVMEHAAASRKVAL
jgi:restriction endonuclease S subunit